MKRYTYVLLCVLLIAGTITAECGCKKASNKPTTVTTTTDSNYIDSITSRGCYSAGGEISFSFLTANNGPFFVKSMQWDFGDGTTSPEYVSVEHTYSVAGSFTVTLTANGRSISTVITIAVPDLSSPYTAHMGGKRNWQITARGYIWEFNLPGEQYPPVTIDTTFTVQVVNNSAIILPLSRSGTSFLLNNIDTTQKTLTLTDCLFATATVTYYYMNDSIVYTDNWYPTSGHEYEDLTMHSP